MPRDKLGKDFVALLEDLAPDRRFMRLFSEVVRHAWKQKRSAAEAILKNAEAELGTLADHKNKLVDFFIACRIDQKTYDQQVARLSVDTEAAEGNLRAASLDQLDVEAVLAFADKLIKQPQKLWRESSLDQKQKLQRVFFPDGVTVTHEGFGTASSSSFFGMLGQVPTGKAFFGVPDGI